MAEIASPRIESISDPGPGPQDQPSKKTRLKTTSPWKSPPPHVPEISQPEEEEKHKLDEMA
jgi:hypothetical protein